MNTSSTAASASSTAPSPRKRRIGIVGCGSLGQYLIQAIKKDPVVAGQCELAFVWNRSMDKVNNLGEDLVPLHVRCTDLRTVGTFTPDLIVEVCHPAVSAEWGTYFLRYADFYCGSPTALADPQFEYALRQATGSVIPPALQTLVSSLPSSTVSPAPTASTSSSSTASSSSSSPPIHGVYIPAGALWGAEDIRRMADRKSLGALTITMKKHPLSMKLEGDLGQKLTANLHTPGETVLYQGSVRQLCPLAPNNVNTMAAAAIAGYTLGFDGVQACLVSDPSLDAHVITIDVQGLPKNDGSKPFRSFTERYNPAPPGAITGSATYASFLSSLLVACGKGSGIHLC